MDVNTVSGVTVMKNKIFIVRHWVAGKVEVYDCKTFKEQQHLTDGLEKLNQPFDIAACQYNDCLYVGDAFKRKIETGFEYFVHRVGFDDEETPNLVTHWSLDEPPEGLSTTTGGNVLVAFHGLSKLIEFTTNGVPTWTISLPDNVAHPSHAIKLSDDEYVVAHGWSIDRQCGVCMVDKDGNLIGSFSGEEQQKATKRKMGWPAHMAINKEKQIYVTDFDNKRILLLSSSLEFVKEITTGGDIRRTFVPERLYLEETGGNLYIADNSKKDVFVCKVAA